MFMTLGYILRQPEPDRISGIGVVSFPNEGLILGFDHVCQNFALTSWNFLKLGRGTVEGQGGLIQRRLDLERCDPEVPQMNLANSFLARSEHQLKLGQVELVFTLEEETVFPFVYCPEAEERARKEGDAERIIQRRFATFQTGVFYPIEFSSISIPYLPFITKSHRPGLAAGVFQLADSLVNRTGLASVRFVYEEPFWNLDATDFFLYRYGRPIGTARRV